MSELTHEVAAARFKMLLELFDAGVDLQRQNLRRKFPEADAATIESYLTAWLLRENEPGDAPGKSRKWPHKRK